MTDTQAVEDMAEIRRRLEVIKAAMLRTSELLEMMLLDQRKAQTLLSLPDKRYVSSSNLKGKCLEKLEQTDRAAGEILPH